MRTTTSTEAATVLDAVSDRIGALRAIAEGRSDNLDWVDPFVARRILRVFDMLAPERQAEFRGLNFRKMFDVADRLTTIIQ